MPKLPDFIICGFMKCGTTVMWHNMNNHPDIVMGKSRDDPKKASTEIRFWNNGKPHRTWKKGIDWYKGLFSGECSGEKCANYIESAKTMERIFNHIPNVKIILCVRNPVDRAYSEFQMMKKTRPSRYKVGFRKLVGKKDSELVDKGLYFKHIKNKVMPYFSMDNVYISVQERMKLNTNEELNRIYSFLGLEEFNNEVNNVSHKEKDVFIDKYKVWKSKYKSMDSSDRKYLNKLFKPNTEKLYGILGEEVKEWQA